jgi:protocatechuate 3,4-dioxygenase beta subunit
MAITNDTGLFQFMTVFPGKYGPRPSHLHFMLSRATIPALVTQIYFEGDTSCGAQDDMGTDGVSHFGCTALTSRERIVTVSNTPQGQRLIQPVFTLHSSSAIALADLNSRNFLFFALLLCIVNVQTSRLLY